MTIALLAALEVPLQAARFTKRELKEINALIMPITSMKMLYFGVHAKAKNSMIQAILPG